MESSEQYNNIFKEMEVLVMLHVADIKNWFHHIHFPAHDSIVRAEKVVFNRKVWIVIGFTTFMAGLIALMIWAARSGYPPEGSEFRTLYPYPYYP